MSEATFGDVLRRMAPAVARINELENELARLRTNCANADQTVANAMRLLHEETDRAERAEADLAEARKWLAILNSAPAAHTQSSDE